MERLTKASNAALLVGALALSCVATGTAAAEDGASRRASERTSFSDDEIAEGFFKIAFGAELQVGARVERIRRFDGPARVFVFDQGMPKRSAEIAEIIADIGARVRHLDVAMAPDLDSANVVVVVVAKHDLKNTVRTLYGPRRAKQILRSLDPQCLSSFGKDDRYRISHAEVILPADADQFTFRDCAYEELLQALGPINDDRSVPWTMFNDNVQMGFFDVYDQYLLNILYDPRIRPGMTKAQVAARLPQVLPTVREWVAGINSPQPPRGGTDERAQCDCPKAGGNSSLVAR